MPSATIFEEHSSVLPHWLQAGVRQATLVCLDAHLDLQFIEPGRIERLRAATTLEAVQALESRHPLDPDRQACFGIEDFLYPAAQLGVIRRLVWIAPPHVLAGGAGAALGALQQMEGVTPEQLASFHRTSGGWIEGRLLGLDLAVGTLDQLRGLALQEPVLLDVDADYFVLVPQDRLWTDPSQTCKVLHEWLGTDVELTISRSVGTGFLPLRHRFIGDLLAAAWTAQSDQEGAHWARLFALEREAAVAERAVPHLREEVRAWPGCAATHYALGMATTDAQERDWALNRAAALDGAYADDPLRRLGEIRARGKSIDLARVLRLERDIAAMPPGEWRAAAWVALGLLHAGLGRHEQAIACDKQSRSDAPAHPELALEIGKLWLAAGDTASARPWLERAAGDDETRLQAWLQLAACALQEGDAQTALHLARAAHEGAPAWPVPLQWMAGAARAAGDVALAASAAREAQGLTQHLAAVRARVVARAA